MRINALPQRTPILVVEGKSDVQMLQRYVSGSVKFVPARGKDVILGSLEYLTSAERDVCTFVIDCDGEVDFEWRGAAEIVISQFRDLDVDTAMLGDGTKRAVLDYLGPRYDNPASTHRAADQVIRFAALVSARAGVVLDAARTKQDLPTKIRDQASGSKRRVRLADIPNSNKWIANFAAPDLVEVAHNLASVLGWSSLDVAYVLSVIGRGGLKLCRLHQMPSCGDCIVRRFCSGHDLHAFISDILSNMLGHPVRDSEVARAIRVGTTMTPGEWHVLQRLAVRGTSIGVEYVDRSLLN